MKIGWKYSAKNVPAFFFGDRGGVTIIATPDAAYRPKKPKQKPDHLIGLSDPSPEFKHGLSQKLVESSGAVTLPRRASSMNHLQPKVPLADTIQDGRKQTAGTSSQTEKAAVLQ